MPRLMTIRQYARFRGVSLRLVRQWVAKGAVTVYRLAPRTYVRIVVSDEELRLTGARLDPDKQ